MDATKDPDDRRMLAELIEQRKHVGWVFWLCWVLATTVGHTAGGLAGRAAGGAMDKGFPLLGIAAVGALLGGVVGGGLGVTPT